MNNPMKKISRLFFALVALVSLTPAVGLAQAVVTYDLFIDGDNSAVQQLVPGTYSLRVEASVTGLDLTGGGVFGGILQSAFNLGTDNGSILFEEGTGFLGAANGLWNSTDNPVFDTQFQGTLINGGTGLVAETSTFAPGNFTTQFAAVGANQFDLITEGNFTYDGSDDVLTLDFSLPFGGDITVPVVNGAAIGSRLLVDGADQVIGDSIQLSAPVVGGNPILAGDPAPGAPGADPIDLTGAFLDGSNELTNFIELSNAGDGDLGALSVSIANDTEGIFSASISGNFVTIGIDGAQGAAGALRDVTADLIVTSANGGDLQYSLFATVPEPTTLGLAGLAMIGMVGLRRRS